MEEEVEGMEEEEEVEEDRQEGEVEEDRQEAEEAEVGPSQVHRPLFLSM